MSHRLTLLILLIFVASITSYKAQTFFVTSKEKTFFGLPTVAKTIVTKTPDVSFPLVFNNKLSVNFSRHCHHSTLPKTFYPQVKIDNGLNQNHHKIRAPTLFS